MEVLTSIFLSLESLSVGNTTVFDLNFYYSFDD